MDPDQVALSEASSSGSTVFSKKDKSGLSRARVNITCESAVLKYQALLDS